MRPFSPLDARLRLVVHCGPDKRLRRARRVFVLVLLYFVFFNGGGAPPQQNAAMVSQMGGNNLMVNGELLGPVDIITGGIAGWGINNAVLSVVDKGGRADVIKVADGGSFSDMAQTITTKVGQKYTISFDVWSSDTEVNTEGKLFCSSGDSNGQLIIRAGETKLQETAQITGSSHCGGDATGTVSVGEHCHGSARLCPESSDHWVTVSGTYTATSTKTTFALHSEGSLSAYFDEVYVTTAENKCKASTDSADPEDPTMCQCSHLKESQQGAHARPCPAIVCHCIVSGQFCLQAPGIF